MKEFSSFFVSCLIYRFVDSLNILSDQTRGDSGVTVAFRRIYRVATFVNLDMWGPNLVRRLNLHPSFFGLYQHFRFSLKSFITFFFSSILYNLFVFKDVTTSHSFCSGCDVISLSHDEVIILPSSVILSKWSFFFWKRLR